MKTFEMCQTEYGIDDSTTGARHWARLSSIRPQRPIDTAAAYVGVCRRLARGCPPPECGGPPWLEGEGRTDGRLVAVGFRHVPPSEWIRGERRDGRPARRLVDFLAWWEATQKRPETVGSSHNGDPDQAFQLWSAGPFVRAALRGVAVEAWQYFASRGRLHPRNLRKAREIGRAAARASARECDRECDLVISARALAALGRCCPEMQRAALASAERCAIARVRGTACSELASYAAATASRPMAGHEPKLPVALWEPNGYWYTRGGWGGRPLERLWSDGRHGRRGILQYPCAYASGHRKVAVLGSDRDTIIGWYSSGTIISQPATCSGIGSIAIGGPSHFARATVVRVRDLDWSEAAWVQSEILRDGDRARLRLAYRKRDNGTVAKRFTYLASSLFNQSISHDLALKWATTGVGLTPSEWLIAARNRLFKVLKHGQSFHGGSLSWSLPVQREDGSWEPGEWHEVEEVEFCKRGFHLTWNPARWGAGGEGCEVYEVEASELGEADERDYKVVARRVRLLRKVAE